VFGGVEMKHLLCLVLGHKYKVDRVLPHRSRKVGCSRCACKWAMNDATRSFLPWDAEFEHVYSPSGPLGERLK
jgi:hypothetical protein